MTLDFKALRLLPAVDDALVPAPQLPSYIGIARQTLDRWRVEGKGPAYIKLGGRVFYRAGDVRAWIEGQRRSSTSDIGGGHAA